MIIAVAGAIGSGKTTFAYELGAVLGLPVAGFGDYVRSAAAELGLDPTQRQVQQDLGQRLVQTDPRAFLDAVLSCAGHRPGAGLVLEGLRHTLVLDALRQRQDEGLDDQRLIYLDAPLALRRDRALARGLSAAQVKADEAHVAERDLGETLRREADLVLQSDRPATALATEAARFIASRGERALGG